MRLALVGANCALARHVVPLLASHELAGTDTSFVDLRKPEEAAAAVADAGVLLHFGTAAVTVADDAPETAAETLDHLARGTYHLLQAAAEAGVTRVVVCSTVEVMLGHSPRWRVNESYRPRPLAEPLPLAAHLMETVCEELALERNLPVVCLRLGRLCLEEDVSGQPHDSLWLDLRDAAAAVHWATEVEFPRRFHALHVVHRSPRPRVESARFHRRAALPATQHNFEAATGQEGARA
ncbi:MAG: hypothetical protein COZ06_30320 [Armatimonadetes bacterium CG_4_10_14_3_um_filter_66_18]|nr:NAD(P)-dependent oxidoreductase [Armatimonadota bacterium]OIP06378.1 MAG: hypothetical protein AUJ96_09265 [Armatimonadetes bacterium CG2_30_66_41]PIU92907.1 MAG: hypothetical protein COS65_15450 [Armatimonadetes bacterium CG06_land_8_20_14_3_00_66_21]PIX39126.1 MAG: hypothetical protein COZ57_28910 [Armatimonadetes bacterium CG_4_8_14_3_um_filter_66_20]PIY39017.1 MAG: hypothetical protein COZ06_30320 [Armatimonadetes bacterium CG_4_10_14_3_um_filter_66_18]PIZ34239.1 MAG: hypothetical prote